MLYSFVFMTFSTSCCLYDTLMNRWNVCMYVCIYMYVFMYVCLYVSMCMYVCMYMYMYLVGEGDGKRPVRNSVMRYRSNLNMC